jgi:hypothetical protein
MSYNAIIFFLLSITASYLSIGYGLASIFKEESTAKTVLSVLIEFTEGICRLVTASILFAMIKAYASIVYGVGYFVRVLGYVVVDPSHCVRHIFMGPFLYSWPYFFIGNKEISNDQRKITIFNVVMNTVESIIAITLLYTYDNSPVVSNLASWNLRRFILLVVVASWAINKVVVLVYLYLKHRSPALEGDGNASWFCKCDCVSSMMNTLMSMIKKSSKVGPAPSELVMVGFVQGEYKQVVEALQEEP